MIEEYLLRLEKNLMVGSARWIADFRESFRGYQIGDTRFDMMIRGGMRAKGFLISRLVSYLSVPDYQVACFVYSQELKGSTLQNLVRRLLKHMKEEGLDWAWLVIPKEGAFSEEVRKAVEKIDYREIGIALVDLVAREVSTNPSYLGERMGRHIRCFP